MSNAAILFREIDLVEYIKILLLKNVSVKEVREMLKEAVSSIQNHPIECTNDVRKINNALNVAANEFYEKRFVSSPV